MLFTALSGTSKEEVLLDHGVTDLFTDNVRGIARGDYRRKTESEIRGSGYVVHCLEAAIWCFLQEPNFKDAVLKAVNLGDDADTTGAVCGQLAGAYYGESGIPPHWLERLVMRDEIRQLAEGLWKHRREI